MKEFVLGMLCLVGVIVASGCSGGGPASVLPSAGGSQAGASSSASTDDIFVNLESTVTARRGGAASKLKIVR
jgi:hypothetical protein